MTFIVGIVDDFGLDGPDATHASGVATCMAEKTQQLQR